jgi:beta-lactamase class D
MIAPMLIALSFFVAAAAAPAASPLPGEPLFTEAQLAPFFNGFDASFRLVDPTQGRGAVLDGRGAAVPVSPWSTFKILNALIALETGVATGPDFAIPWDRQPRERPEWNQEQTLRTAVERSAFWYFQELARRIGPRQMQKFRPRSLNIVKDILRLRLTEKGTLRGKTGSDGKSLAWFVGWVEHEGRPVFFATQLRGHDGVSGAKAREITEQILAKAGLL